MCVIKQIQLLILSIDILIIGCQIIKTPIRYIPLTSRRMNWWKYFREQSQNHFEVSLSNAIILKSPFYDKEKTKQI